MKNSGVKKTVEESHVIVQDLFFYEEDIVELEPNANKRRKRRKTSNAKKRFGMILQVGGNENTSYEDTSDSDEPEANECQVKWSDGNVQKVNKSRLIIRDRALCHGNVVKKLTSYPKGMSGTIIDVHMMVDLDVINTDKNRLDRTEVKNINSRKLMEPCAGVGIGKKCIYLDQYVSKIKKVYYCLEVLFVGGDICQIEKVDPEEFIEEREERLISDTAFPFNIGQKIYFGGEDSVKRKTVFYSNEKERKTEGEKENVQWLQGEGVYRKKKHKSGVIIKVAIQFLDLRILAENVVIESDGHEIGDLITGVLEEDISVPFGVYDFSNFGFGDFCYVKAVDLPGDWKIYHQIMYGQIKMTHTKADVQWQDGTIERGIESYKLFPDVNVLENVFYPNSFVTIEENDVEQLAIVKNMDYLSRLCKIYTVKDAKIVGEKETTCFQLKDHEQFSEFSLGDIVIRITALTKPVLKEGEELGVEKQWVGQLIGFEKEMLEVKWENGTKSKVLYNEILPIEIETSSSEEEVESEGEETDDETSTDEAEGLLHNSEFDTEELNEDAVFREENEEEELKVNYDISTDYIEDEDIHYGREYFKKSSEKEKMKKVIEVSNQFFVVDGDFTRHRYSDTDFGPELVTSLSTVIQKEWKILKESLPENICVFASKSRVDLLQSVIIGASGTPYSNFFFIFDICTGNDYDFNPPNVLCWSFGFEINPNVDPKDDSICLSLLGTWESSDPSYNWQRGKSNIYQVLLSLSSLVFNEKPYFNEAGFKKLEGTKKGIMNSELFNEGVFLSVLKHQIKILEQCPVELRGFIKSHLEKGELKKDLKEILRTGGSKKFNIRRNSSIGFRSVIRSLIPCLEDEIEQFLEPEGEEEGDEDKGDKGEEDEEEDD